MNVRKANKFDQKQVNDMLRNFRNATPIELMRECDNEPYINKIFAHILAGAGVALIAEKDDKVIGIIAGIIDSNIWEPSILVMRELVFWVEPEHRGTTAGYRLISSYNKEAKQLVDSGRIKMYTMTKMVNSPDLHLEKFGYRKAEEVWVAGV
jgi:N-acetylglutamate synthase-like GNAT family acetyltransferase